MDSENGHSENGPPVNGRPEDEGTHEPPREYVDVAGDLDAMVVPERERRIVVDAARDVDFDLEPIRAAVREGLRVPCEEYIWDRADRIAGTALRAVWEDELEEAALRALDEVHDDRLVSAARCLDLRRAPELEGRDAWFVHAFLSHLVFRAVTDVFDEGEFGETTTLWEECWRPARVSAQEADFVRS